jgi:WhiB family transcriptional regulator, redox-sensing transcriptional regulator
MMTAEQLTGALCAQTDSQIFFPEPGQNATRAKAICGDCYIQESCLEEAMAFEGGAGRNRRFGIFGGLDADQRAALAQERGTVMDTYVIDPFYDEARRKAWRLYRNGLSINEIVDAMHPYTKNQVQHMVASMRAALVKEEAA